MLKSILATGVLAIAVEHEEPVLPAEEASEEEGKQEEQLSFMGGAMNAVPVGLRADGNLGSGGISNCREA